MKFSTGSTLALAVALAGESAAIPMKPRSDNIIPRSVPEGVFPPSNALMVRTIGDLQISSVEIQQETIIDNGIIIQNVQNVLQSNQLISSQSNQARIQSFAQQAPGDTTIMKIVQQVNVVQVVGGTTQSMSLFAQSDITANAGQAITNVIQITSQNIQAVTINGGGNNGGGINTLGAGNGVNAGNGANAGNGNAGNAGNANLGAQGTGNVGAKKTTVKLGDAKPTWTSVVNDPAGTKAGGQAKATGGAKKGGKAAEGAAKGEAGAAKGEAGAKGAAKGEAGAAKGEAAAKGAAKGEAAAAKGEAAKGEAAKGEAAKGEAAAAAEKPAAAAEKPAAAKGAAPPKPTKAANVPIFPAAGIQKV